MERNFTKERKSEVRNVIETNLKIWNALDLQVDSTSKFIAELGLSNVTDFADTYRDRIAQKLQENLDILEEKYKDAQNIEKMYSTKHIPEARQSIQTLNEYILHLAWMISYKNGVIDVSKSPFLKTMWNSYESKLRKIQQSSEFAYDVESLVYDINGVRKNIKDVGIVSQKYVVEAYEIIHPEMKEKMDKFLSTGEPNVLTENDITSIKYLAYTAPEPYRTVYLECVGTYKIGYISEEKLSSKDAGAWFSSSDNKIYMEETSDFLNKNPRGAYTTFFHESGHATDYNISTADKDFFCKEYVFHNSDGASTLQKAVYNDVCNDIANTIYYETLELEKTKDTESKNFNSDNVDIMKVLKTFIYGSENVKLCEEEKIVRETVRIFYETEYSTEKYEAVSDICGGVTNLKLFKENGTGYAHRNKNKLGQYTYWYEWDGEPTMSQSKEFVAIYFSQLMTGDREAIEATREHFPNACRVMDEMFTAMKENINNR